jgi:uncharacterized protein (UPF0333 family)
MNAKLEYGLLVIALLLLAVTVCPPTAQAQIQSDVQSPSGFHSYSPISAANTTGANNNATSTAQPPEEDIIQENQMPLMIVIIVAAFAVYIAVIAVLSSKKIR